MKAIFFEAPRQVSLTEHAAMPQIGPGEVLIHCSHVGLCGSNVGPYLGDGRWRQVDWPAPPGWMGHENVGTIVDSRCDAWPAGTPVLAQSIDGHGFAEFIAARPEAMARLPTDNGNLGDFVIAQPLATVLRALARTEPPINQRCAVVGQGPIGLMFTHMLRRMGAAQVIAIDLVPWRLAWSKQLGATHVIDASREDTVAVVRELTHGEMIDFCIEAGSTPEALIVAAYLVRYQGRLCPFGVPHGDLGPFPWYHTTNNETQIVIARGPGCQAYFQRAVDMVAGEYAELVDLVTPRLPWEEAARAFEMYADPAAHHGSLKVTLELPGN